MSKHIARLMVGLSILLFGAMFMTFDIATAEPALNQNTNSSTTTQKSTATPQQRSKKRTPAKPSSTTTADPSMPAANPTTETPAAEAVPPSTPAKVPAGQEQPVTTPQMLAAEQTDLSGTYTGTFVCDPAGINGETTLTINGNEFTTADGKSGRIVATTTRGYTAVVLQVNNASGTAAAATAPTILSLRARKSGNRLTLLPVSDATGACTFTPAATARSRRTRGVKEPTVPAATGTEVSNPAVEPTPANPEAGPMPPPTPSPKSTRGRAKKTTTTTPAPPKPSPTPPQP